MKSLLALDPQIKRSDQFISAAAIVKHFQDHSLLADLSLSSVLHPDVNSTPRSWFNELKDRLKKDALQNIESAAKGIIKFQLSNVIISSSSAAEDIVGKLSRLAIKSGSELLVLFSNDRRGLPFWILGSFSQTASLMAQLPVLIIKPYLAPKDFSKKVRFVVGIDPTVKIPSSSVSTLLQMTKDSEAEVDFVYVSQDRDLKTAQSMQSLAEKFKKNGIKAHAEILPEEDSVAQTIISFADRKRAWMIVTINAKRGAMRKLLIGSASRQILSMTKRPFLNLREG